MPEPTNGATAPSLLDAEAEHRRSPRTFSIPRRVVRESLVPGDLVKLLFVVDPRTSSGSVERLWVEVIEASADGYVGRLDNRPDHVTGIREGEPVTFGPRHVAARWTDDDDPLAVDPAAFAVVSRRVWDSDAWPRRLERRAIPDPRFSGWFVFAGEETDAETADPMRFVPVSQADALDRWRVLDSGLEGPIGTVMVWDDEAFEYRERPAGSG